MNKADAEYHVSRIIAGCQKIKIKDICGNSQDCLVKHPTTYHKYIANELYREVLEEAFEAEMYTQDELTDFLLENGFWSLEEETRLTQLKDDIEELKVRLYENAFNSSSVEKARKILDYAKHDITMLSMKKTFFDHLSAEGFSNIEKNKYLVTMSLYDMQGQQFFNDEEYWETPSFVTEQIISSHRKVMLSEGSYRWMSRNEPWRTFWMSRKTEGCLFGIPPIHLNEEQKTLIVWSSIYDNINEHPECPASDIMDDDDLVDGWMIIQRRNREKSLNKKQVDNIIRNDKIRNSGEVFIPATSANAVKKIAAMNDAGSDIAKRVRMNHLNKVGVVNEMDMPDSAAEIRQTIARNAANKAKGKM